MLPTYFQEGQAAKARKNLSHALRYLHFGLRLLKHDRLRAKDFLASKLIFPELSLSQDWVHTLALFAQIRDRLLIQFLGIIDNQIALLRSSLPPNLPAPHLLLNPTARTPPFHQLFKYLNLTPRQLNSARFPSLYVLEINSHEQSVADLSHQFDGCVLELMTDSPASEEEKGDKAGDTKDQHEKKFSLPTLPPSYQPQPYRLLAFPCLLPVSQREWQALKGTTTTYLAPQIEEKIVTIFNFENCWIRSDTGLVCGAANQPSPDQPNPETHPAPPPQPTSALAITCLASPHSPSLLPLHLADLTNNSQVDLLSFLQPTSPNGASPIQPDPLLPTASFPSLHIPLPHCLSRTHSSLQQAPAQATYQLTKSLLPFSSQGHFLLSQSPNVSCGLAFLRLASPESSWLLGPTHPNLAHPSLPSYRPLEWSRIIARRLVSSLLSSLFLG